MENRKLPYMLLSNHMHFIAFELAAMGTWPYPVSNVITKPAFATEEIYQQSLHRKESAAGTGWKYLQLEK